MQPHFSPPPEPFDRLFPSLPIVTPPPEETRRSDAQKYGALYYLGVVGLAVVIALLAWFAWGAWSLRSVWVNVYVLHQPQRSTAERVQAAYALSRDPKVNPRQLWDIALEKPLPPLARFVVAEGLTADVVNDDPHGYAAAVARSENWPDWLRLVLLRPMAYRAALGRPLPREPLDELSRHNDPAIRLWASYTLAASQEGGDSKALSSLRSAADAEGPLQPLALDLVNALDARRLDDRIRALDAATLHVRTAQPEAARLWTGWNVRGGRLVPEPAP
jgi:hypothetical protein